MIKSLFIALLFCSSCFCYTWRGQVDLGTLASTSLNNITFVTVTISDSHLKTVANGGTINDASCSHVISGVPCDLLLTDAAGCGASSVNFKWGYEKFDGVAGTAIIWIKVPVAAGPYHAIPYVCTGDTSIHSYLGGSPGDEFDSNTKVAYHMADSGSTVTDFSASANNGNKKSSTQPNVTTSGKIGSAQTFVGQISSTNNDYITFGSPITGSSTYTLEAWLNESSLADHSLLYYLWLSSTPSPDVGFGLNWFPSGTVQWRNSFNTGLTPTAPTTVSVGSFYHLVFVRNGNSANIYVNGVAGTAASGYGAGTDPYVSIGWSGASSTNESVIGTVDEVRYSNTARASDWIAAEAANQSAPPAITNWGPVGNTGIPPAIY